MTKLQLQAPILLQNETQGPLVFQDNDGLDVVWQAKGDPIGADVQPVPMTFLENANFIRILNKGTLSLYEASDDIREQLEAIVSSPAMKHQATVWQRQQQNAAAEKVVVVDRQANRDFVTNKCLGPDSRGTGNCGIEVSVREVALGQKPPLCPAHAHMAPQFISTEVQAADGTGEIVWSMPRMDAPARTL